MDKEKISREWTCESLTVNPLRFKQCVACGRNIPRRTTKIIYYEEIKIQKAIFYNEKFEKSVKRCKIMGNIMQKSYKIMVAGIFTIVFLFTLESWKGEPQDMQNTVRNYSSVRIERVEQELFNIKDNLSKVMRLSNISHLAYDNAKTKISIMKADIGKVRIRKIRKNKLAKVQEKIRKVMDYVTRKFK